jgi:dipeptidyl-peptidase 4
VNRTLQINDFAPLAPPAGGPVQSPCFDSEAQRMAFLQPREGTDLLDLVLLDIASGTSRLLLKGEPTFQRSLADQLARERSRTRYDGVTNVRWIPGRSIVYTLQGPSIVFVDIDSGEQHRYVHGSHIDSAEPLSDGQKLAFASSSQLWLLPVLGRAAVQLTDDGTETLLHGKPDPVTSEEIFHGAAYSAEPGGSHLLVATFHLDEVETVPIPGARQSLPETSRYGLPGGKVATFSLSRLPIHGGARHVIFPADPGWPYFLGLTKRNESEVVLLRLSRDQTRVQWWCVSGQGADAKLMLELSQQPWINAPGRVVYRSDGSFLIVHEQLGTGRIGLFDAEGKWLQDIGDQCGHVESLLGSTRDGHGVWFIATGGDARERHVYHASPSTDWVPQKWTESPGVHGAHLGMKAGLVLLSVDNAEHPLAAKLMRDDGTVLQSFQRAAMPYEARLAMPSFVEATAADGKTTLYAAVYAPGGPGPHPVVLLVYGGPHGQAVKRSRSLLLDLRAQWLVSHGYIVVKIDNRGTNGRGMVFERDLYCNLGTVEVEDQVAVLQQILQERADADRSRIGVLGWSYGGYMALRCLQHYPDLFRCAVAGAPVVNWEDYDAAYTERYMGTPQPSVHFAKCNSTGYKSSSVVLGSVILGRQLLLIHGLNDENVMFRHSAALMEQLAQQRLPYDLLLLPDERHSVRSPNQRMYVEWRIQSFFDKFLKATAQ